VTEVAAAAGFASLRRFHSAVQRAFGRAPRELRRGVAAEGEKLVLRLALRPPYDWAQVLGFLGARVVPGLEQVDANGYVRAWEGGLFRVFRLDERALGLEVSSVRGLERLVTRVRRVFDLDADPREIAAVLGGDRLLRRSVKLRPGLRVPGAWDGFELAVRAILGQQVSVARAAALVGELVARAGERVGDGPVTHRFPDAGVVRRLDVASFRVPRARGRAIVELAARVADGRLCLDGSAPLEETIAGLEAIPGVGPWTAAYVAMRALGAPDALPVGDLGLVRAFGGSARALEQHAEAWRPFRAYAAMHLWTLDWKERA
jgi:AraC family transcriptional regulator, regulatory protein of adaptative response / DNA-3-methyladenine glycosylase II